MWYSTKSGIKLNWNFWSNKQKEENMKADGMYDFYLAPGQVMYF